MAGVLSADLLMPCASAAQTFELDSTKGLQPHDVTVEAVTYHGRKAVRVMPAVDADAELVAPKNGEGRGIVVLPGTWGERRPEEFLIRNYHRPAVADVILTGDWRNNLLRQGLYQWRHSQVGQRSTSRP
jgi:hypothetical protein